LGATLPPGLIRELRLSSSFADIAPDSNAYYESDLEPGFKRLQSLLEESAFWSGHLFACMRDKSWWFFAVSVLVSIMTLLATPVMRESIAELLLAQIFCTVAASLVAGGALHRALSYQQAAEASKLVAARLQSVSDDNETLVHLTDYNAIVEATPTIPSKVYQKNRERLNRLWKQR
jgi:hypothetical protein